MNGFVVIDKPPGITSHDVVAMVRAVTGLKKVGHTGTLDPFATGVLPLALGSATKLIRFLDESIKIYDATISLGAATDTGDHTGTPVREAPLPTASEGEVRDVLLSFLGDSLQTPPAYSAVKKDGKPLYKYAREGREVSVPPRQITVHALELQSYNHAELRVLITCSRGTYARVLGDDIAVALESAGHLAALERRRSGPFLSEHAMGIEDLSSLVAAEEGHPWRSVLMSRGTDGVRWKPRHEVRGALAERVVSPLNALSHLPAIEVDADVAQRVRSGGKPPVAEDAARGARYVVTMGGELVAVARAAPEGGQTERVVPAP